MSNMQNKMSVEQLLQKRQNSKFLEKEITVESLIRNGVRHSNEREKRIKTGDSQTDLPIIPNFSKLENKVLLAMLRKGRPLNFVYKQIARLELSMERGFLDLENFTKNQSSLEETEEEKAQNEEKENRKKIKRQKDWERIKAQNEEKVKIRKLEKEERVLGSRKEKTTKWTGKIICPLIKLVIKH